MNVRLRLLSMTAAIAVAAAPRANAAEYSFSCIVGALVGASAGYGIYTNVAAAAIGPLAVPVGLGVVVLSGIGGCAVAAQAFPSMDNSVRLPSVNIR